MNIKRSMDAKMSTNVKLRARRAIQKPAYNDDDD
jgi:hypothetical protein